MQPGGEISLGMGNDACSAGNKLDASLFTMAQCWEKIANNRIKKLLPGQLDSLVVARNALGHLLIKDTVGIGKHG